MRWRIHPDSDYSADDGNKFLSSSSTRLFLAVYVLTRFVAKGICVALLLAVLLCAGLILRLGNSLWILLCLGFFAVLGCFVALLPSLRTVPLRCSRCSALMLSDSRDCGGERDVLFYVCPHCKRYVDSGFSEGD